MTRPDQRLQRHQRLTQSRLFKETFGQGRRAVGRYMVMWLRSGEGVSLRLGVVTSRKVGKAVQRVRARRLLREVYRKNRSNFSGDYDVILVGRRSILGASWEQITGDLLKLAKQLGLYHGDTGKPTDS